MPNPFFRFKKFTIWHDKCAMKVGTDGCLLGAWVNIIDCKTILDVGTGSGLIALMLAQRVPNAKIEAIDIDKDACIQADYNLKNSIYNQQIIINCNSFDDYTANTSKKFDLIITNPPFFTELIKSPNNRRNTARHADSLPLDQFFYNAYQLLSGNGSVALILPFEQKDKAIQLAKDYDLSITRQTDVYPTPNSAIKRVLLQFGKKATFSQADSIILEEARHKRSSAFQKLMNDFYL